MSGCNVLVEVGVEVEVEVVSVICIFVQIINEEAFLYFFLKYNHNNDYAIGGTIEEKETPIEALKREIKQEIGIELKEDAIVPAIMQSNGTKVFIYQIDDETQIKRSCEIYGFMKIPLGDGNTNQLIPLIQSVYDATQLLAALAYVQSKGPRTFQLEDLQELTTELDSLKIRYVRLGKFWWNEGTDGELHNKCAKCYLKIENNKPCACDTLSSIVGDRSRSLFDKISTNFSKELCHPVELQLRKEPTYQENLQHQNSVPYCQSKVEYLAKEWKGSAQGYRCIVVDHPGCENANYLYHYNAGKSKEAEQLNKYEIWENPFRAYIYAFFDPVTKLYKYSVDLGEDPNNLELLRKYFGEIDLKPSQVEQNDKIFIVNLRESDYADKKYTTQANILKIPIIYENYRVARGKWALYPRARGKWARGKWARGKWALYPRAHFPAIINLVHTPEDAENILTVLHALKFNSNNPLFVQLVGSLMCKDTLKNFNK